MFQCDWNNSYFCRNGSEEVLIDLDIFYSVTLFYEQPFDIEFNSIKSNHSISIDNLRCLMSTVLNN